MAQAENKIAEILFYYEYEPNGEFSNFYESEIQLKGTVWKTVEHFYQAQKAAGTPYEETVRLAATPAEAKRLGNESDCPVRADWDSVKVEVMKQALVGKFTQIDQLKQKLLATGDARLAENSKKDWFWGLGEDGTGENMLGRLLMQVRQEISRGELG